MIEDGFYVVHPHWYDRGENTIMYRRGNEWLEVGTDQPTQSNCPVNKIEIICAIDPDSFGAYSKDC